MLKYAAPLVKHYKKVVWNPEVPNRIKNILKDEKPLKSRENAALMNYYINMHNGRLHPSERGYLLRYLYQKKAYGSVVTVGSRLLYGNNNDGIKSVIRDDVSMNELKRYLNSLVRLHKTSQLDSCMGRIIAQFAITRRSFVVDIINSIFVTTYQTFGEDSMEPLIKWVKWMKMLNGHCEFTDYMQYKYIMSSLLFYLRGRRGNDHDNKSFFENVLGDIKRIQGAAAASQFATTLMCLLAYSRRFHSVENIWHYKINQNFSIVSADLTNIKVFCHFKSFESIPSLYQEHPDAHDDVHQFDYLLIAHSELQDWKSLQDQFNALFNVGDLPNLRHYGIVMYSLATIGELENVERLYAQLLRRKLLPNFAVLQSLLLVHYKCADLNGCFTQFDLFDKYSIPPSSSTYTIMLKAYRNLNDIDGALRLLKKMTESAYHVISERHFSILIHMCSKITNTMIAEELFQLMVDHYNITPTGLSVAALMDVYIASGVPQESLSLFKKYAQLKPVDEGLISIYNRAITARIEMGEKIECEKLFDMITQLNLNTDSEFYRVMIRYLATLEKDYETAENILDQLIEHPNLQADASHFETMMEAYDSISYRDGVLKLFAKMTKNEVPLNSKILHHLIKSTFKIQIRNQENLSQPIELLDRIMKNVSERNLQMTFQFLHPSVLGLPMRCVAKYHGAQEALQLLNRYSELFYGTTDSSTLQNRFVILRSLLVLTGEIQQWEDFEGYYQRYVARIEKFQNTPSATQPNKRMKSLMVGLFAYKVKHLLWKGAIHEIPQWMQKFEKMGLWLDNDSWNEAVMTMFKDSRTIEFALKVVNEKLIHGYNLIHKYRLLRHNSKQLTSADKLPWLLQHKKLYPESFRHKLYLKSDVATSVMESMDQYLNCCQDLNEEVTRLAKLYPYFMKNYLMHPRNVNGWDEMEKRHSGVFQQLRVTKKL
ncbi:hypothetical protein ZYGR_0R01150 [Zygosaccharomyces rouxii]|uniref:Mitochondrial 15S rRNA processing factor CCM1 n=1 Tax=Zygosaccharomyces rouxii TaxID=4956 RepID=A0A1Q3A2F5_ZYGRO|nr:hypothetical protein ZYGR_0R01150 [Zygosaccharomyces rouxii]